MKTLFTLIAALALCLSSAGQDAGDTSQILAPPNWTYESLAIDTPGISGCNGSSCSATITVLPGDLLIAAVVQPESAHFAATGVTGGGGTWQICTACEVYAPDVFFLDVQLVSSVVTASGSVTVAGTIAGSNSAWSLTVTDIRCTTCQAYGPITFDKAGTTVDTTCTVCTVSSFNGLAGQDFLFIFFYSTSPFPTNSWPAAFTLDPTAQDILYSQGAGIAAGNYTTAINGTSSTTVMSTGIAFRP
jgi:hypothetical protein